MKKKSAYFYWDMENVYVSFKWYQIFSLKVLGLCYIFCICQFKLFFSIKFGNIFVSKKKTYSSTPPSVQKRKICFFVPRHQSSVLNYSNISVARSLVFCVVFYRLKFCFFSPQYQLSFELPFLIPHFVIFKLFLLLFLHNRSNTNNNISFESTRI